MASRIKNGKTVTSPGNDSRCVVYIDKLEVNLFF